MRRPDALRTVRPNSSGGEFNLDFQGLFAYLYGAADGKSTVH